MCHEYYAEACHEKKDKLSHLNSAVIHLNQVRGITEPEIGIGMGPLEIIPYKLFTSYHIGKCYYKMGNYSAAISNFKTAYWLAESYKEDWDFLITQIYSGYAYLYNRDHSMAVREFKSVYQYLEGCIWERELEEIENKERVNTGKAGDKKKSLSEISDEEYLSIIQVGKGSVFTTTGNRLNESMLIGEIYIKGACWAMHIPYSNGMPDIPRQNT